MAQKFSRNIAVTCMTRRGIESLQAAGLDFRQHEGNLFDGVHSAFQVADSDAARAEALRLLKWVHENKALPLNLTRLGEYLEDYISQDRYEGGMPEDERHPLQDVLDYIDSQQATPAAPVQAPAKPAANPAKTSAPSTATTSSGALKSVFSQILQSDEKDWKRTSKTKNGNGQWVRSFRHKSTGDVLVATELGGNDINLAGTIGQQSLQVNVRVQGATATLIEGSLPKAFAAAATAQGIAVQNQTPPSDILRAIRDTFQDLANHQLDEFMADTTGEYAAEFRRAHDIVGHRNKAVHAYPAAAYSGIAINVHDLVSDEDGYTAADVLKKFQTEGFKTQGDMIYYTPAPDAPAATAKKRYTP